MKKKKTKELIYKKETNSRTATIHKITTNKRKRKEARSRISKNKTNREKMHTNVAVNATVHLVNSQLFSDNMKQILNMNKRMKVRRRKLKQSPSQSTPQRRRTTTTTRNSRNSFASMQTSSSKYRITSTKNVFLGLLTLWQLLGLAACIGKYRFADRFTFFTRIDFVVSFLSKKSVFSHSFQMCALPFAFFQWYINYSVYFHTLKWSKKVDKCMCIWKRFRIV